MDRFFLANKVGKWFVSFLCALSTWISFSFYLGQPVPFEEWVYRPSRKWIQNVPVYIQLRSEMLENYRISVIPEHIDFLVKGRQKFLNKLESKDIMVYLTLKGMVEGEYEIVPHIELPRGVSLALGRRDSFIVKVEKIHQSEVQKEKNENESLSDMIERVF